MARPPINLHRKVREVLQHTGPMPPEANCPLRHFDRTSHSGRLLIEYFENHLENQNRVTSVCNRHMSHLHRMVLSEMLQSFERFIKELASVCVDLLAPYSVDDRFDEFVPKRGEQIAVFVNAGSIGKALCESDTWCKNDGINKRFKAMLKLPFGADWENLFPEPNQQPVIERERAATLTILWQIRHNLAHNVGALTESDTMKFRMLIGGPIGSDCVLSPTVQDLRYISIGSCPNSRTTRIDGSPFGSHNSWRVFTYPIRRCSTHSKWRIASPKDSPSS